MRLAIALRLIGSLLCCVALCRAAWLRGESQRSVEPGHQAGLAGQDSAHGALRNAIEMTFNEG